MKISTRLVVVAVGAAAISVGCFSGSYALATANDSGSTEVISRELPWDDSTSLSLGVRSVVRYVQQDGPGKVVARGPHRSVSTLVVSDGHIHDQLLRTGATLELTIFAPAISRFQLNSGSRLSIEGYDQPHLHLSTEGSAFVEAIGRADSATIEMQGKGIINLSRFTLDSAEANIGGMSTLVLAPSQGADLKVRNFAAAVLLTRPPALITALADSGRVVDAARR
jgi:Putative auto-transporter adhesin, head GIN domain